MVSVRRRASCSATPKSADERRRYGQVVHRLTVWKPFDLWNLGQAVPDDFIEGGFGEAGGHVEEREVASEAVRFGPVAVTTFGVGLLLLAVGGVLTAVAVARSGVLPRLSGVLYSLGFVLFLPQFYTPPAVRIAHGVLLGLGAVWLAAVLWRRPAR